MSLNLLKSTFVISSMTFISRVLGFVRDMVAAHFFGAGSAYDAFIVASKIPNFMRRLFAEGAFSQAFVPILSEYRSKQSKEEVQIFVNRVAGCFTLVLTVVTVLGILLAPLFIFIFAPGFATVGGGARFDLAVSLLRITFPYLLFISLTAFAGGILNSFGKFAVPAITPVFLNIMMILCAVCLSPFLAEPVVSLSIGIFLGGLIQLFFQVPFLKQIGLLPKFSLYWKDPGVRRILTLMLPALLGVSVNQLNLMLSSVFASFLPVGSVSWLYYAERLMEFPMGGFGVALATVVLPRLSRQHAVSANGDFSKTLDWGVRWVLLLGMPAALSLALLAGPMLATLFQSGRFTEQDVLYSQTALVAYSLGIMGFMLVKIFASAYYAKQDIKTPVRVAILTVIVNAGLSAAFFLPLAHTGLALATSLAALLNAGILGMGLFKRKIFELQAGTAAFLFRLSLALLGMSAVIYYLNPSLDEWFRMETLARVLKLGFLLFVAGSSYIAILLLSGLRLHHVLAEAAEES